MKLTHNAQKVRQKQRVDKFSVKNMNECDKCRTDKEYVIKTC